MSDLFRSETPCDGWDFATVAITEAKAFLDFLVTSINGKALSLRADQTAF